MKRINEFRIIFFCLTFLVIQVFLYFYNFSWSLSSRSEDWAAFSTFFGLSLSFASALFIYLTYRSQTTMSSVLQFESIFFQWYQQHHEIGNNLKKEISYFSSHVALPYFETLDQNSDIYDPKEDESTHSIMPYYRSLYQLMRYIHQSEIIYDYELKKKYIDIVQSQMTDGEYNAILYLLLHDKYKVKAEKFEKPTKKKKETSWMMFVDKYHLLKNIYYSRDNKNYDGFKRFMHNSFPETQNSFYSLK